MSEADARLEALEFKIAHLERTTQELSDVLYAQQRQLDELLSVNRQLLRQLETLEARSADATRLEIPPHY
jgi:SlyX protein